MEDLQLLASLVPPGREDRFAEAFLRNMLDLTLPRSHATMLLGLRWHFLLGTLPLSFASLEDFQSRTSAAVAACRQEWVGACTRMGKLSEPPAPSAAAHHSTSGPIAPGAPAPKGRLLAKFDSSSSSSSESDERFPARNTARWHAGTMVPQEPVPRGIPEHASPKQSGITASSSQRRPPENPLCPSCESRYELEFHVESIRKDAQKDIDRLNWELPLFERPKTRKDISDILVAYCVTQNCGYKQGMHEIVAFLYYIGFRDRRLHSCDNEAALAGSSVGEDGSTITVDGTVGTTEGSCLAAPEQEVLAAWLHLYELVSAEEDHLPFTYSLFRRVMLRVESVDSRDEERGLGLASWFYTPRELQQATDGPTQSCPKRTLQSHVAQEKTGVVVAAECVQQDLLLTQDAELQHRLDSEYGIQSTTYLIRWLRLLFLREFSFGQSAVVWTTVFAEQCACAYGGKPFDLQLSVVMHLATAMLLRVRKELMIDCTHALTCLMRYPEVADIRTLLCSALVASRNPLLHVYTKLPAVSPKTGLSGALTSSRESLARGFAYGDTAGVSVQQGERLRDIIATLEGYWFPPPNITSTDAERRDMMDKYVQAIAELKHVRDVLLFGLDS